LGEAVPGWRGRRTGRTRRRSRTGPFRAFRVRSWLILLASWRLGVRHDSPTRTVPPPPFGGWRGCGPCPHGSASGRPLHRGLYSATPFGRSGACFSFPRSPLGTPPGRSSFHSPHSAPSENGAGA
jgi:hypothetical protein